MEHNEDNPRFVKPKRAGRKLDRIFDELHSGKPYSDIVAEREKAEKRGNEVKVTGAESEKQVELLLATHKNTSGIQKSKRLDRSGIDFRVQLRSTDDLKLFITNIDVQAKSSEVGVDIAKKKLMQHSGIDEEALNIFLKKQKLIFLIGTQTPEEITAQYERQLEDVNNFHKPIPSDIIV